MAAWWICSANAWWKSKLACQILLVLIILASVVDPNVYGLLPILSLFSWMALVGVVCAEFLRTRNFEFVRAAKALGVADRTILRRHVLPNTAVTTLTYLPFILNGSITSLTALDFLGFGLPLDAPSFGRCYPVPKRTCTPRGSASRCL